VFGGSIIHNIDDLFSKSSLNKKIIAAHPHKVESKLSFAWMSVKKSN
jgi:hypothetical protein